VEKNTVLMNNNFQKNITVLSSYVVNVSFNQLNIKKNIKKDNFGGKKTMWRNTIAINNVLKTKITKPNSQSTQYLKKNRQI